jgi:nitrite reductase/ring-hydroxylating ferredoxin subunit
VATASRKQAARSAERHPVWRQAISLERLNRTGKAIAKIDSKQLAIFATTDGILACNNRCPHEGFPLREGTLDGACVLTCNWHNWKFDLRTGENLYGGDALRIYPTRIEGDAVWVDIADPPAAERQATILASLRAAFDDEEYDRIARELARFARAGADPAAAVTAVIGWSHDRLEFGTTHAYAAAPFWLQLHDASTDPQTRLICLTEAIGYMSWEVLREPRRPYPAETRRWDEVEFLAAIEAQDEAAAIGHVRGALTEGLDFSALEPALTRAALRHYADFGHSLIYLAQTGRLVARLGVAVTAPLVFALVRSFVFARREDLIPEFRGYAGALGAWPASRDGGRSDSVLPAIRDRSVDDTMAAVVAAAGHAAPAAIYTRLFDAAAMNLLQFDSGWQAKTDASIAQNVGWLDFSHALTFANAARRQCTKFPELWPAALLQMACFLGRTTGFTTPAEQMATWRIDDREAFYRRSIARLLDHGEDRYILAAHLLKTFLAIREEVEAGLPPETEAAALAALNRFINAPLKRKHVRRTAHQALAFTALED